MIKALRRTVGETLFKGRAEDMLTKFYDFLPKDKKILDFGAGTCLFSEMLTQRGFSITSVDIRNKSYYQNLKPIVYDGSNLPFEDNSFDTCMLIAVLHHTPNPEHILREAKRVATNIIILEDIYTNIFQKYYTFVVDSILNKEFIGHPHTNKTDSEWKKIFQTMDLSLIHTNTYNSWGYILNSVYILKRTNQNPV